MLELRRGLACPGHLSEECLRADALQTSDQVTRAGALGFLSLLSELFSQEEVTRGPSGPHLRVSLGSVLFPA